MPRLSAAGISGLQAGEDVNPRASIKQKRPSVKSWLDFATQYRNVEEPVKPPFPNPEPLFTTP